MLVPAGDVWNWTFATPAVASLAVAVAVTVARTNEPAVGAVTEPVGAAASTTNVTVVVDVLPATSVAVMT